MDPEETYSREDIESYLKDLAEELWSYLKIEPPQGWHPWLKKDFEEHFEAPAVDYSCDCRNCLEK